MTSILILLGMFSLILMISNLGFLKKAQSVSYISLPIVCGYFFSSEGVVPILPSTLEGLSWALRVALTWVTFIAGTRLVETAATWTQVKKLVPFFVGYLLFCELVFMMVDFALPGAPSGIMSFFSLSHSFGRESLAIALILSSALFSSEENPFLLFILFVSLLLLSGAGIAFPVVGHLYALGIGLLMGVVCRLVISPSGQLDTPTRLALVGLCVLGTGWAVGMGCLEVLVGLAFGWSMAIFHRHGICSDPKLKSTEAPLRLGIALFAGLYLNLTPQVIVIGVCAALIRFVLKWLIVRTGLRTASRQEALTQIVPISHLALPAIVSIHLSQLSGPSTSFLLGCFCVGFVTNDVLALIVASLGRTQQENSSTSEAIP